MGKVEGVLPRQVDGGAARLWPEIARLALVAIFYWIATQVGLAFVVQPEGIASIWPPSGIALAALLSSPRRRWVPLLLVIFATNTLGNLTGGNSLPMSLGFALANTVEPAVGVWVIVRVCGPQVTFARVAQVLALCGVAVLSNGVTALPGAAVPSLALGAPFLDTWFVWWVADGLGILLITPAIVTWATSPNSLWSVSRPRLIEGAILVTLLTVLTWLVFGPFAMTEHPFLRSYMVFPLLIWAALRFSPRGTATTILLFAVIVGWNIVQGYHACEFAELLPKDRLLSAQILLGVTTLSGLVLSAVVTERKRSEEALQATYEQLQQTQIQLVQSAKMAAVGTLAAGVAHEINNPMTAVLGFAELLLQSVPPDDPNYADLVDIVAGARRVRDIVRGLLAFSRRTPPYRERVDINQIVQDTLSLVRQQLETSGIVLEEYYDPDLPALWLDVGQMRQVVLNLVTNAVQATSRGDRLTVSTARVGDEVTLRVADTGAGISPEDLARVFEPFFTTKPPGQGTGLGLSISQGIVQEHGGRIQVESQVDAGAAFTVWLPIPTGHPS